MSRKEASWKGEEVDWSEVFPTFEPWMPPGYEVLKDVIDMHIHAGSGRIDPLELAKLSCEVGMRALVYKSWRICNVEVAALVTRLVKEYAKSRDIRPIEVFGGLCLDKEVCGGLNPLATKNALTLGAKKIWMPMQSSASHISKMQGISLENARRNGGIYILDDSGELVSETQEIINLVAEAGVVLACGHISYEETMVLLDEAKAAGVKYVVVDHPPTWPQHFTLDQQVEMSEKGAYINYCAEMILNAVVTPCIPPTKIVKMIKTVGSEHCILTTDYGWVAGVVPYEAMRVFIQYLLHLGLHQEDIDIMAKRNPTKMLGLDT